MKQFALSTISLCVVSILVVSSLAAPMVTNSANQPLRIMNQHPLTTTISTPGAANAISSSSERKLLYSGSYWWSFWTDSSGIYYSSSSDGVTWSATALLGSSTLSLGSQFSVWLAGTNTLYYVIASGGNNATFAIGQGTLNGAGSGSPGTISGVSETHVPTSYTSGSHSSIITDSSGNVWVAVPSSQSPNEYVEVWECTSSCTTASSWSQKDIITGPTWISSPGALDTLVPYGTGVGLVYSFDPQALPGYVDLVTITGGVASTPVQVPEHFASFSATSIGSSIYVAGSDVDNTLFEANVTFFSFSSGHASALTNFTTSSSTCCAFPTTISESNGNTLVVFYAKSFDLYYVTSTNGGSSWSTPQILATVVTSLEDISAEFSSTSGTIGVSYLDYEGGSPAQFLDFASVTPGTSTTSTATTTTTTTTSSSTSAFSTDQAASLVIGQPNFGSSACLYTPPTATSFCTPYGVAIDSSGNLWVADEGNSRVLEFASSSLNANGPTASLEVGSPGLTGGNCPYPTSYPSTTSPGICLGDIREIAFDSSGNLYVADHSNGIIVFKPPFSTAMDGNMAIGRTACTSNQSSICQPDGMAFDSRGDLWVADGGLNRVLEFSPPFSPGELASIVIGQPDFTTRTSTGACNPATSLSLLCEPKGVAFDPSGNLWVSDYGGDRVLEFKAPFTSGMSASLVVGTGCPVAPPYSASATTLCAPRGIAFDSSGNLWVADTGEYRVLEFAPPFTSGATLVLGQTSLTTSSLGSASQTSFEPEDLSFDSNGNIWVSDNAYNRVLEFLNSHSSTTTSTTSTSSTTKTSVSTSASSSTTFTTITSTTSTYTPPPIAHVSITLNPDITSNSIGGNNYFLVSYNDGAQEFLPQQGGTSQFEAAIGTQVTIAAASSSSNSKEEWCLQGSYTGSCNPIAFTVSASGDAFTYTYFDVLSQSVSYAIHGGGNPVAPSMTFITLPSAANPNDDYGLATVTLSTTPQTVWALRTFAAAQTVQLSNFGTINTSPPAANEQWSAGFGMCCAILGPDVIPNPIVFYNQYLQQVSFSVTGKSGYSTPILSYISGGASQKLALSTTPFSLYIDEGSSWSATNPLLGSTPTYSWKATTASGAISGLGVIDPAYSGSFILQLTENSGISDFTHLLPEIQYKLSLVETSGLTDTVSAVHSFQRNLALSESIGLSDFVNTIHGIQYKLSLTENTMVSDIYHSLPPTLIQLIENAGIQDNQNSNKLVSVTPFAGKISFIVHSPVNILVSDSLGRQAGFSANASIVNTIPGAQVIPKNGTQLETIIVPDPITGNYEVQVFPVGGGGAYTVESQVTNANGTVVTDTQQTGTVTVGTQYLGVTLSPNGHISESVPSTTPPFQNKPSYTSLFVWLAIAVVLAVAVGSGLFVLRRRMKR